MAKKARRTILRSSKGKKLYAVRNKRGQFKDIQSYKRCSRQDQKRMAGSESRTITTRQTLTRALQAAAYEIYTPAMLDRVLGSKDWQAKIMRDLRGFWEMVRAK